MRVLLVFVTVFLLATGATAQKSEVKRFFDEGTRAAQTANYENALENFRRAEALAKNARISDELQAKVHFNLGVCLYRLKKSAQAVEEFTKTVEISRGTYTKAFYALGMAQSELKNWSEAEKSFLRAIKSNETNGEVWFDLAMVYLARQNFDAARESFQNAVKYKSVSAADAHNNLGVIFALAHDFQSAEKEFETAASFPRNKSAEAENNLRFCKFYKQNAGRELIAGFQFSKTQAGN